MRLHLRFVVRSDKNGGENEKGAAGAARPEWPSTCE